MTSSPAIRRKPKDVIDLVSDDDSDVESSALQRRGSDGSHQRIKDEDVMAWFQPAPLSPRAAMIEQNLGQQPQPPDHTQRGFYVEIDGDQIYIPDEGFEEPGARALGPQAASEAALRHDAIAFGLQQQLEDNAIKSGTDARDHELAMALEHQTITADTCLQRVLEIFPDINHEYVTKLYNDFGQEDDYESLHGQARLDNIIEQLVSVTSYPKQEKGKLKRKREPSVGDDESKKWERKDRAPVPNYVAIHMRSMLKAEFPYIPVQYINDTLKTHEHFYHAYLALAKANDDSDGNVRPFGKGRPSANLGDALTIAMNGVWPDLIQELNAARAKVKALRDEKALEQAKREAEKQNLERAIAAGETSECSACYDDLPMNRQIHCSGPIAHFTCYDCALTYIKAEVGESRCRVLCTAGCGANFANHQLQKLADKQLLEKLSQLQQEKDIRDAGLDDLEECPFCDYKAILPPIEEDFEFRCANPECEKISCRRCKSVSHIPVSCEQHAKDSKVNNRHKIEEAMSAALIRSCNKCKNQFVKDFGCNKMTCPSCRNTQCYVCSTSLTDYNHFDQGPSGPNQGGKGKCPLYDNVEERHEKEVKEAEAAARAQVVAENPDVSMEDLEIKVSDAVKKATADRIRQGGGPAGMVGGFDHMGVFNAALPDGLAANRARLQAAQREAFQARRRARMASDLQLRQIQAQAQVRARILQAERAAQNAQRAYVAQANQPAQNNGLLGAVQGYIPVLWNPPAPAPPGQWAVPAAPPQPQRHNNANAVNNDVVIDFDHFLTGRFGNDGTADQQPAPPANPAPANNAIYGHPLPPNNNNNLNNPPLPGAWPNHQPVGPGDLDIQGQMRIIQAHQQRQLMQQRMQQLQMQQMANAQAQARARVNNLQAQVQARANNRQANTHNNNQEQQMRRLGFPPGS